MLNRLPMSLLFWIVSIASFILFSSMGAPVSEPARGADLAEEGFGWREIPESAILRPERPFTSDLFTWVASTSMEITVRFNGPATLPKTVGDRPDYRFVVIVPLEGIASADLEFDERVFLKDGERVELEKTPPKTPVHSRVIRRQMGEFRGAKLFQVEYKPAINPRTRREADTDWIPDATLLLRLAKPFRPERDLPPLLFRSLESFLINPSDIERCFPPVSGSLQPAGERLRLWRSPTLEVSTREEGWHSIPAGRLLTEWGRGVKVEELGLYSRGALLAPPKDLRVPEDPTPAEDRRESLFVFDSLGDAMASGTLDGEDRLFFHAELSDAAYDPERVYWLIRNEEIQAEPVASTLSAATDIGPATLAKRFYSFGEDREFVRGGLRNEKQGYFWTDRPFPEEATKSLNFTIPDWALDAEDRVQGRIVLVMPSASERSYVPAGALQSRYVDLEADGKKLVAVTKRGKTGFNFSIEFELPKDIREATLSLVYDPPGKQTSRPYLDRFELETSQPLIWAGTDCSYELASSGADLLRVEIDGDTPHSKTPPAYAFGRLSDGTWVHLDRENETPLEYRAPGPLVEVSFLTSLKGKSVEGLDSFTWPKWFDSPPKADQLVLSPKIFKEHLVHIGKLNEPYGYRCEWIDIEEVFDLFSGGQFSPFALRNFLSWITRTWPDPQPASILLVGDTTWDPWNRIPEGKTIPNWTPSYHDARSPDFPSDLWFTVGQPKDRLADWLWGRIPCQTIDHLEGYLAKRYDFEERSKDSEETPDQEWSDRLLWVSDDNSPVEEHTQALFRKTLPQAMRLEHIRIRDYPFVDNFYYGSSLPRIREQARNDPVPLDYGKISPACNRAILQALTAGAAVFVYYGHSGPNVLAHERVLFGGGSRYSDIPSLRNEGKAPLAFLMTCDVGRFDYALADDRTSAKWSVGLSEELLFHRRGGCLALVSSAGKGLPGDHRKLLRACLDGLFNRGLSTCGEVVWAGKTQCLIPPGRNLSIAMFTLFGDPLFIAPAPRDRLEVQPLSLKWNRDGSLGMKFDVGEGVTASQADCWMLDDDLAEMGSWNAVAVSQDGKFDLTLPDAREMKTILLACKLESNPDRPGRSKVGAFGLELETIGKPRWTAPEEEGLPNLRLLSDEVVLGNYTVREGETLFIEARVRNTGTAAAENVEVRAFDVQTDTEIESFAEFPPADVPLLLPGESKSIRIRWDRWSGTGNFDFTVKADPDNKIEESNEEDNNVTKTIRVYTKPDLAWGLVRGSTAGAIDFKRAAISIPVDWVQNPRQTDLKQWSSFRPMLSEVDRGILLKVPLTNFGESESATCSLSFTYHFEGERPSMPLPPMKIPPIPPSLDGKISVSPVPVLILPGMKRIEIDVDPEGLVDESDVQNNRLSFTPPSRLWDAFPSLVPKRKPPKALRGR